MTSFLLWKVLSPLLVLGILIFLHELGHFLAAKYYGVGVIRFAIGFGPAIVKFKRGETTYQIGIIPLGGYVRMVGDISDVITDSPNDEIPAELLNNKKKWFVEKPRFQQAMVVLAGPVANLITAVLFVFVSLVIYGKDIPVTTATIGTIFDKSPAQEAGLKDGDLVLKMNEKPITTWQDLRSVVSDSNGNPISVFLKRGDEEQTLTVIPKKKPGTESQYLIGVEQKSLSEPTGVVESAKLAFMWTGGESVRTLGGIWGMVSGAISAKELAGPIFILDAAGNQAKKGLQSILHFMALLSVSLAVLNLLPIPILDGGHLFFYLIESIFGPIRIQIKEKAQLVGGFLLLLLMGFALTNDIRRPGLPEKPSFEQLK
jgi:regulator of sigma E protease